MVSLSDRSPLFTRDLEGGSVSPSYSKFIGRLEGKSVEEVGEILEATTSNDERSEMREVYILMICKRYLLVGKSNDEIKELLKKKKVPELRAMMKDFNIPWNLQGKKLKKCEMVDSIQEHMKDSFNSLWIFLLTDAERKAYSRVVSKERMAYSRVVSKHPSLDTKVWECPGVGRDYTIEKHEMNSVSSGFLFLLNSGPWMEIGSLYLVAYIHVWERLVKDLSPEGLSAIRKLEDLYLLSRVRRETFIETMCRIIDERCLERALKWKEENDDRLVPGITWEEVQLEWFATDDSVSLDERALDIPPHVDQRDDIIDRRLKVPGYWWIDKKTGRPRRDRRFWECMVDSIDLEGENERYFNIKCLDDTDDPDQKTLYPMAYTDVLKYTNTSKPLPDVFCRPLFEHYERCDETMNKLVNLECDHESTDDIMEDDDDDETKCYIAHWMRLRDLPEKEKSVILRKDVMNEAKLYPDSQTLTNELSQCLIEKFCKAQGRGVPWAENEGDRVDSRLLACVCCGSRSMDNPSFRRSYERVDLANSKVQDVLKLRDGAADEATDEAEDEDQMSLRTRDHHVQAMEMKPLSIPYNDNGDTKEVDLWRLCSVWPAKKPGELIDEKDKLPRYLFDDESGDPVYFHLHPEFVDEEIVPGEAEKKYTAYMCSECKKSIDSGVIPRRSIASGVDFGDAHRIGLEPLTERERQIISKIRHYLFIVKIESNTKDGRVIERGQSKVKGCGIYFNDDSPQVVSNLLSQESINKNVSLRFVGPEGEYDALAAKVLGNPNVEGRAWVIYQWLRVLQEVNCHYQYDDKLPEFEEVKAKIDAANKDLVKDAECVDDECVARKTAIAKDDARNIRTHRGGVDDKNDMETGDDIAGSTGDFPLRCSLVTSSTKQASPNSADQEYLVNAAKSLGIKEDKTLSRRGRDPLNEYEYGDELIAKASPDVFIFGSAYGNKGPTLFKYDIEHLLLQYTTSAARNRPLLFQLFESKWRHSVISGMHAKVASDRDGFELFATEFTTEEFQAKLKAAVKNPSGVDAKYILNKLTPLLTYAGRKCVFGALERNESAGQILAMGRRHGCAPAFLTFGIDDVNHPNAIRFALRSLNNDDFPASVSHASQVELKQGLRLEDAGEGVVKIPFGYSERLRHMVENPVGAALVYRQVVHDIMAILVGTKASNYSGDNNKTVKTSLSNDGIQIGIAGASRAFFGKNETTHSGSLHFHAVIWAGLSPEYLELVSDIRGLCNKVSAALDSTYCTRIDRHLHVQDLVQKETRKLSEALDDNKVGVSNLSSKSSSCDMDAIPLITDDDPSESSSSSSPPVDMSIPGAFASTMCCADEKCNGRDCTDDPISDPPPSKRARTGFQLPPNIIEADNANMTLPAGSRPKNTASGNTSIPRVLEEPPHPVKESEKFKTHVGLTVCYCGIHTHSFTCKKPPKGFHGCRMCYGRALSNGTRPIELFASVSDGVIQWDELDPCDKPLAFEDYDRHDADGWVSAIDPDRHTCKRNLYHLGDDCSRTIIWELDRPVEEPLQPELANDMTKDEIISSLYQQMFQHESNVGFTEDGCRKFKEDHVDYHIFHRRDNNHLFYSLLLGLVETEQVSPGDKSIEGLRRDLMYHLDGKRCDDIISTTTQTTVIRDYIEPRVAQSDIDMDEQLKLYSQLMKSATGDQCFGGGELEIHLFSEVTGVNVAVYDKTKGELRRMELIGGNANRPTIHLLRETTKSESVGPKSGNNNATGAISPPKHHYTLFTPKFKGVMHKLQTFDVKHLRLLYNTVSDSLRGRNAWVVDFNPLLTSLLGCNSNLLHLGSTEQSKAALFYIGPYINKDGLKITDALPILLKAREHTLNFPSIADDADTNKRHVQHTLTRTLNKMNNLVEVSDTQGASSLLGMGASLCSDLFVTCDVSAIGKFVGYDLRRLPHNKEAMYANEDGLEVDIKEKEESAGGEDEEEEEKQYYDETDILSGDIEDMFGCHSKGGGGDGGDSENGSLDSDQTGEDKEASSGVAYSADDFQVTEEEDGVDLEMAQRMSGTCSNDESSGLESDEQMSASCNHDGGDSLSDTEDGNETRYQTGNITNKTSDTQYEDCNVLDRDSRRQIARNRRKHHLNQIEDNEEDMIVDDNDETLDFKHINASCGVTPLYRSNDGMSKIPVSYAALYRYRGRELAWMPRYLYYACVRVETSDTGKCSKAIQFGEGLGIEKRYHQVLRFKQCTLRFTGSPPVLPEKMPEGEESDEGYRRKRRLWDKKANRFGMFYLLMFRAEDTLYEKGQLNTYKYDYDAFKEFYRGLLCSRKKYDCLILRQMKTCIFSWRVDKERREMLADFRGRKKNYVV